MNRTAWTSMYDYPANRLDVANIAGRYCAWEVRGGNSVSMCQFNTLAGLLEHARLYAGLVLASPELRPAVAAAGLLYVRDL